MVRLVETVDLEILVDPDEFTTKTLVLPCRDRWTGIRVDFMFCWSIYEQEALRRCRSIDLLGTAVRFASLEDVVIY